MKSNLSVHAFSCMRLPGMEKQQRDVNLFSIQEPICWVSMLPCARRVHFPRLECRTDATHVLRCTLGTGVRVLNWMLAASAGFSALCLAAGISRSGLMCRLFEVRAQFSARALLSTSAEKLVLLKLWTLFLRHQMSRAMVCTLCAIASRSLGTTFARRRG